ncbi:hypothetical protein J6590_027513 [Homalodisca vitripennis]|nr:hypothetical protein J6590_027513 [Homalodisca vitripennis]
MSHRKNEKPGLNQLKQAGCGTPLCLGCQEPLTLREQTPPTPIIFPRSRLDLSNYPCAPEFRHLWLVTDTSAFAVRTVGSTGKYKPARSEPSWGSEVFFSQSAFEHNTTTTTTTTGLQVNHALLPISATSYRHDRNLDDLHTLLSGLLYTIDARLQHNLRSPLAILGRNDPTRTGSRAMVFVAIDRLRANFKSIVALVASVSRSSWWWIRGEYLVLWKGALFRSRRHEVAYFCTTYRQYVSVDVHIPPRDNKQLLVGPWEVTYRDYKLAGADVVTTVIHSGRRGGQLASAAVCGSVGGRLPRL